MPSFFSGLIFDTVKCFNSSLRVLRYHAARFLFLGYFRPRPASTCRSFPLPPSPVVSHGSTNDIFQSAFIDSIALVEINRSPSIPSKAGVEELVWIRKAYALRKGHFYLILMSVGHADESIVRPARRAHPFPFLDDLGISVMNDLAKLGKHLAAPIRKICDVFVNKFGWVHWRCTPHCRRPVSIFKYGTVMGNSSKAMNDESLRRALVLLKVGEKWNGSRF